MRYDKEFANFLLVTFSVFTISLLLFLPSNHFVCCLWLRHRMHHILNIFVNKFLLTLCNTWKFLPLKLQGPHLLAPTGSDLGCYGQEGTVFAGYHYDLNFLTIHGRSRFPGLNIWLRNGQKVQVKVPLGCLLIQTGKQVKDIMVYALVVIDEDVCNYNC